MKLLLCLPLQLMLAFAFSLDQILARNPPGFISLDCGLTETNGSVDSVTDLNYSSDEAYIETGESRPISPQFRTGSIRPQYLNVRSFPGDRGSRNCYTLKPLYGKGSRILLRVTFKYGNYDDQNKPPQFDLHLGVDYWVTVKVKDSSSAYFKEILHIPTSNYLYVCLVNTGLGTPFISMLELRPMAMNDTYGKTSQSLYLLSRADCGSENSDDGSYWRYNDDPYDRLWMPFNPQNTIRLSINGTGFTEEDGWSLPPSVMNTACESLNNSIYFSILPYNPSDQVYIYLHFAELVPNRSREIIIYLNGSRWTKPFVPIYLLVDTWYSGSALSYPNYEILISTTSNSSDLPAILNAYEFYTVKHFPHPETNDADVSAIISIKATYAITSNWQGDPCSRNYSWIGINCSYNVFASPNITSLNLSSSGLTGTIAPSISNLTNLQSLDLSYNNLTGQVPDFLSRLSLTYLNLKGNNFSGSLPPALQEKSNNGSLILSADIPFNQTNPCANGACKKKNNTKIVPVVASVAGFIAIFILSTVSYIILRRKRQVAQNLGQPSVEPKLRQFTFSEVMSFIGERRLLGEGGFGSVYRGCMDGIEVAIKLLNPGQETRDFQSEAKILATVHHRNLTRILGYCYEGINRAIIFELMENGNLRKFLSESSPNVLSWEQRLSIMIDAAQGLEYLHHGCDPPIIHRDIKPENILLTREFVAKIADFGLSRIFPVQTSRFGGTPGYHDPQYVEQGALTEKIDIYSFGVVMLVVVTGRPALKQQSHITDWIAPSIRNGDIRGIVDPRLQGNWDVNAAWRVVELAMACASSIPSSRPNMHDVVKELKQCLETAVSPQNGTEGRRHLNDKAGIEVAPPTKRSVFRPSAR